jgi:iron complex transport system substrate-binding protein
MRRRRPGDIDLRKPSTRGRSPPAALYAARMRIVSLLASGTELVCALGAGDELVGRSHECDRPDWVTRLPALSHPTFDTEGSSAEIDRHVREALRAGRSLYQVDEAGLEALAPDVVITQTHCQVCAVSPSTPGCDARLSRKNAVALRTGTIDGILQAFADVAEVLGRPEAGARLVAEARAHLARWEGLTATLPRPRVVCLEWIAPPFALGNWGPRLVSLAGGHDVLGADGGHSAAIDWQAVREADPEVLVVAPCGFGLARTAREMPALEAQPGWASLRAVRAGRVFIADGNLYFNRSGPSVFETIDVLAEILHPDHFPARHQGSAWRRW